MQAGIWRVILGNFSLEGVQAFPLATSDSSDGNFTDVEILHSLFTRQEMSPL